MCSRTHALVALLSLCVAVVACDEKSAKDTPATQASSPEAKADAKAEAKANAKADAKAEAKADAKSDAKPKGPDACAWMDADGLRKALGVPAETTVESKPAKFVKNTCVFTWKVPGEAKPVTGELTVALPSRTFADAGSAAKSFDASLAAFSKAMTAGGKPPEMNDVEGVGDKASWVPGIRQLSVLHGDGFMHLTLGKLSDPALQDRPKSLELAKQIANAKIGG